MNVLSLFSGIGGLDLGLERAGMTRVGQVEIDPFCQRVLAAHWPEVPRHDDIRTCVGWWRRKPRPPVHVVAGGFPCQPVSVAGGKHAQADPRWLWPAMAAVIDAVRPRWVIAENVTGLFRRGFDDVLRDLSALGFDAEWDCIPASAVGAPHVRDRVFIIGWPRPVAHTNGQRLTGRAGQRDAERWMEPANGCGVLADAEGLGWGTRGARRSDDDAELRVDSRRKNLGGGDRIFGATPLRIAWPAEPDVRRVAHGVPSGVDRLRSLGNSVVPQVAQHVGGLVMAAVTRGGAA